MENSHSESWPSRFLRDQPALVVSVIYVFASMIGMVFSWDYLRQFGLNVFDFAQVSDFLIASLKEPFTWFLVAIAIGLVAFDNAMSRKIEKKGVSRLWRWYGSSRYRSLNYLTAILIVLLFLHGYAVLKAQKTMAGEAREVDVTLAGATASTTTLLLGTTGQFLFLYNAETRQVTVHPHENVESIVFTVP